MLSRAPNTRPKRASLLSQIVGAGLAGLLSMVVTG
jgi:hypothetical protein